MSLAWFRTTYIDGANVNKSVLRDALRDYVPLVCATVAEFRLISTAGIRIAIVHGQVYAYDADDTTTADDGDTYLVSADGKRFKRQTSGGDNGFLARGPWVTSRVYDINDMVHNDGDSYICYVAHTSGATTEPGTGADWEDYWTLNTAVGAPGLVWHDAGWATATAYVENDALAHGGTSYRCVAGHTSGSTSEPGVGVDWADYWEVIAAKGDTGATGSPGAGLDWQGAWVTATAYAEGDGVERNGSAYICTAAHTSGSTSEPGVGASWEDYWNLFAAKGAKGDAGDIAGPGSSVVGNIATFANTGGSELADSGIAASAIILASAGALVFKGAWDASAGSFPGSGAAQKGWFYIVSVAGTVDGKAFDVGDSIYALDDNASTSTYASNWQRVEGVVSSAQIIAALGYTPANDASVLKTGKRALWIPAAAFKPAITNGPSVGYFETSTNKNIIHTLDFDSTTSESAQAEWTPPPSWDRSTITFIPVWSHPSTTTNFGVVWALSAVARGNGDALDVAFGTAQQSADTGGTTDTQYDGPESSAITVAGSPAQGDTVNLKIARLPSDGSDTMSVDARLHGVIVIASLNSANDA